MWLELAGKVQSWRDLPGALFTPTVHGTIRPFSERGFFLLFYSIFGPDALPFRIWVFLTQCANLVLLALITRRLTGSRFAGFAAAVLWVANSRLATAMSWTSAYMQVLCGFTLLLAFYLLLRHIETGKKPYWYGQWAVFLLGFGVMETNVVYPALAATYALLCARPHFRKTLPLFIPSVAFVVLHMMVAPKQTAGPYSIHIDWAIPVTFTRYWMWAVMPSRFGWLAGVPPWLLGLATGLISAALAGFAAWQLRRRRWVVLVLLAWFVYPLAPVLPLRDHAFSDYYLTLPVIGLAMLGAHGLAHAFQSRREWAAGAVALVAVFLVASVPVAFAYNRWWCEGSHDARKLVMGVLAARRLHPHKTILLTGVETRLFWAVFPDHAFRAFGVRDVFVAPGSESQIRAYPELGTDLEEFVLEPGAVLRALERDELVVYRVGGERLKNVTTLYAGSAVETLKPSLPRRVDASNPILAYLLGPTWHSSDGTHRWMPRHATLALGGPRSPAEKLHLAGRCPPADRPIELSVLVDGYRVARRRLPPGGPFAVDIDLPAAALGKDKIEVALEVDHAVNPPGDGRELALAFGVVEIR